MVRKLFIGMVVALVTFAGVTTAGVVDSHRPNTQSPGTTPLQSGTAGEIENKTAEYPPGTSEEGIENVTRLMKAHHSVLNNSTYKGEVKRGLISGSSQTGFEIVPLTATIASGPNGSLSRQVNDGVVNEYWITENATAGKLSYVSYPDPLSYEYHNTGNDSIFHTTVELHDWLNSSTYEYTGTLTRNNQTLHEFWATGLRGNHSRLVDIHARVLVSPQGVVHETIVTRTSSHDNETVRNRLQYAIQRNVTVPTQPEWVTDELPHLDASVVGNGTVIALEHQGGKTIVNGSIDGYFPDVDIVEGDIEDFQSGETLYLYRTQNAPDLLFMSENEVPTVNESFVPVGEDFVFVSVFTPFNLFASDNASTDRFDIEIEPRDR